MDDTHRVKYESALYDLIKASEKKMKKRYVQRHNFERKN